MVTIQHELLEQKKYVTAQEAEPELSWHRMGFWTFCRIVESLQLLRCRNGSLQPRWRRNASLEMQCWRNVSRTMRNRKAVFTCPISHSGWVAQETRGSHLCKNEGRLNRWQCAKWGNWCRITWWENVSFTWAAPLVTIWRSLIKGQTDTWVKSWAWTDNVTLSLSLSLSPYTVYIYNFLNRGVHLSYRTALITRNISAQHPYQPHLFISPNCSQTVVTLRYWVCVIVEFVSWGWLQHPALIRNTSAYFETTGKHLFSIQKPHCLTDYIWSMEEHVHLHIWIRCVGAGRQLFWSGQRSEAG